MTLPYSDQKSWSPFHERLHKQLTENPSLLPKNSGLLIALSGGQDSMALVGLLLDLQRIYKWNLIVWHGDHAWHSASHEIAMELKHWCDNQKIPFFSNRAKPEETESESSARDWRYKCLELCVKELSVKNKAEKFEHVLTGHTSTDRTETLLLNLARGSNLAGLSSLRKTRLLNQITSKEKIHLVRPILGFSREETKLICNKLGLPIWLDPSNENQYFHRNRIRHEIIPLLEELHPGCSERISAMAERFANYNDDQSNIAELALTTIAHPKGISRLKLLGISYSARSTLLAVWFKKLKLPSINANQLLEISKSIGKKKPPGHLTLKQGWVIQWNREFIEVIASNKKQSQE